MKTLHFSNSAQELQGYAQLQRQFHVALRAQHPEWVLPNGDSPTCDSYELCFAELLRQTEEQRSLANEHAILLAAPWTVKPHESLAFDWREQTTAELT